jgi:UDP-N-acetylglucosamine transferase subunit ALG13
MEHLKCFVTVGSTQFDELIESVLSDDVLARLKSLGIDQLTIQFGAGKIPTYLGFSDENENGEWSCDIDGTKVVAY